MRSAARRWLAVGAVVASAAMVAACSDDVSSCDEDIRAQVLDERVDLSVGDATFAAELADSDTERARGWRHRLCEREAILLVGDGGPMPIWMCEVPDALDLVFVHEGAVVAVEPAAPPCSPPCDACPRYGEGIDVDAVIEWPAGRFDAAVGDTVRGLP